MSNSSFIFGAVVGVAVAVAGCGINSLYQKQGSHGRCLQTYPNMEGRILLENDKMIVQRFTFPPGVWEGVHAHPANQLYIYLTDASFKVRFGDKTSSGSALAGSVGWYGPVDYGEDHESVNIGENPVELIWVTLQDDCPSSL